MNDLLLILLAIFGIGAVIADIVSADRALYHRMQNGDKP
jgi:hypothetical protein